MPDVGAVTRINVEFVWLWFAGNDSDDCVDEDGCFDDYHVYVRGCREPTTIGKLEETINSTDMQTEFLGDLGVSMSPTWDVSYCSRNFCSAGVCDDGYYRMYTDWYVEDFDAKIYQLSSFLETVDQRLLNTTLRTFQHNTV